MYLGHIICALGVKSCLQVPMMIGRFGDNFDYSVTWGYLHFVRIIFAVLKVKILSVCLIAHPN
jgi:hypothetical protein